MPDSETAVRLVAFGAATLADVDGVTVVPRSDLEAVLRAARLRADKEREMFVALRAGQTTVELLDLDRSPIRGEEP